MLIFSLVPLEYILKVAIDAFDGDRAGLLEFFSHQDEYGFTATNTACKEGHPKILKMLLQFGANVCGGRKSKAFRKIISHKDKHGFTGLISTCNEGNLAVLELFLEAAEDAFSEDIPAFLEFLSQVNNDGFSALNSAACAGFTGGVELLLKTVARICGGRNSEAFRKFISSVNKDKFSSSISAAFAGHTDIVKLLFEAAKDAFVQDIPGLLEFISHKDKYGFSAFITACKEGHTDIVEFIRVHSHFVGSIN